jgi:hypothetical protein
MLVFILGRAGRSAGVGHDPPKHHVQSRRVLLGDRRPERAGEIAGGRGKTKVGVHAGELPARRAAKREILACDLLIEGLRGRTQGWRRRQQGGAVERLFEIALELLGRHGCGRVCFFGRAAPELN